VFFPVSVEEIYPVHGIINVMLDDKVLRIGVVDDHPLFLAQLETIINELDDMSVVATAESVSEAKKWFKPTDLDAVVLDVDLPDGNGIGLGIALTKGNPSLGVVFLSAVNQLDAFLQVPEETRSNWGYLFKGTMRSATVLARALRAAVNGQSIVDPILLDRIDVTNAHGISKLTNRQLEVLRGVAQGDSNLTIARNLNISENAVGNHLIQVYESLGIPDGKNRRVTAVLELLNRDDKREALR
jgi:DNA-binding NarL/FixJ family response regulator